MFVVLQTTFQPSLPNGDASGSRPGDSDEVITETAAASGGRGTRYLVSSLFEDTSLVCRERLAWLIEAAFLHQAEAFPS